MTFKNHMTKNKLVSNQPITNLSLPSESQSINAEQSDEARQKQSLNNLCTHLKELVETIETKNLEPSELIETVITELCSFTKSFKKRGKKRERGSSRICSNCGTNSTPEWRRSQEGSTTLCNACGLKDKKRAKVSTKPQVIIYGPDKFHNLTYQTPCNPKKETKPTPQFLPTPNCNYSFPQTSNMTQQPSRSIGFQSNRYQDPSTNYYRVPTLSPPLGYHASSGEFNSLQWTNHFLNDISVQGYEENNECSPNCPQCLNSFYCDIPYYNNHKFDGPTLGI